MSSDMRLHHDLKICLISNIKQFYGCCRYKFHFWFDITATSEAGYIARGCRTVRPCIFALTCYAIRPMSCTHDTRHAGAALPVNYDSNGVDC